MRLPVLQPQQLQRHALAPQLPVHYPQSGTGRAARDGAAGGYSSRLQPRVIDVRRAAASPPPPPAARPQIITDRRQRRRRRGADLAAAQPLAKVNRRDFTDLVAWRHGVGASAPLLGLGKCPRQRPRPSRPLPPPRRNHPARCTKTPESVFGFDRNRCSDSVGILHPAGPDHHGGHLGAVGGLDGLVGGCLGRRVSGAARLL